MFSCVEMIEREKARVSRVTRHGGEHDPAGPFARPSAAYFSRDDLLGESLKWLCRQSPTRDNVTVADKQS